MSSALVHGRATRRRAAQVAVVLGSVGAACGASFGFSLATGWIAEVVSMPVGSAALLLGCILTFWSPTRFGWQFGDTTRRWLLLLVTLAGLLTVVGVYRVVGGSAPYEASVAEFLVVPLGEEALFRGFVLVMLAGMFARSMPSRAAWRWAVLGSAVSFGAGHLGNLGYVPSPFVLVQVVVAVAFGIVAGSVRVRTNSLIGPVLLHAAMNVAAVA